MVCRGLYDIGQPKLTVNYRFQRGHERWAFGICDLLVPGQRCTHLQLPGFAYYGLTLVQVRQVYMTPLLEAKEVLLSRHEEHAQELAALKHVRDDERRLPLGCDSGKSGKITTPVPSDIQGQVQVLGRGEAAQSPVVDIIQEPAEEFCWPVRLRNPPTKFVDYANLLQAKRFSLYIGSCKPNQRRDMPDWISMDRDGWTERLDFKVFKFDEPGTIKIFVSECLWPHRVMVDRKQCCLEGWKERLVFNAYGRPRPRTDLIWIGYRGDPDRCIFVKGNGAEPVEDWERRLEFWVPRD